MFLLYDSNCWIYLGGFVSGIQLFWVLANAETWKAHPSEKTVWRKKLESDDVLSMKNLKRLIVEHNLVAVPDVPLLTCKESCKQHFQDNLYGGLGSFKVCDCSLQGPGWVLEGVEINCLDRLLGNRGRPSTSLVFDTTYIVKAFDPSVDSGVCKRGLLIFGLKISSKDVLNCVWMYQAPPWIFYYTV